MFDQSHIHPMIVHFPIALVIVGFLFDLVGLLTKRGTFITAGMYLTVLGGLGTIAAYIAGDWAGDSIVKTGALGQALEVHEDAATVALWTVIVVTLVRVWLGWTNRLKGGAHWIMVVLLVVGVATVSQTAYYGGELVYRHGAGVLATSNSSGSGAAAGATPSGYEDDDD